MGASPHPPWPFVLLDARRSKASEQDSEEEEEDGTDIAGGAGGQHRHCKRSCKVVIMPFENSNRRRIDFFYGFLAQRLISHTYLNPGRLFLKCAQLMEDKRCLFWVWEDEHINDEANEVVGADGKSIFSILRILVPPIKEDVTVNNNAAIVLPQPVKF